MWWQSGLILSTLYIIGLGIFAAILMVINQNTKNHLSLAAQKRLGFIGIPLHELSHAITALIFGHHLTEVHLLNSKQAIIETGNLGSVSHTWNVHSTWQKFGNFWIGVAPLFWLSAWLVGIFWLLFPTISHEAFFLLYDNQLNIQRFSQWLSLLSNALHDPFSLCLFIYIAIFTALGFGLSPADLKTALPSLPIMLIVNFSIGLLDSWLNLNLVANLIHFALIWGILLWLVSILSLLLNIGVRIVAHF